MNVNNIIAYPVPFNPKKIRTLSIGYKPEVIPDSVNLVNIDIYDINGDPVFQRSYPSLDNAIIWNGYNNKGKMVKPGLYIIKIRVENGVTGEQGNKIIRILVSY